MKKISFLLYINMIYDISVDYTLSDILRVLIALTLIFSIVSAIFFIVWWWLSLIISGWRDDKVKNGIAKIRYSIVWIIVLIISLFVIPVVLNSLFWIDITSELWPEKILQSVKTIYTKVLEQ